MSYLFIDSTYDLTLGVLDDGLNWLRFESHRGQKASAIIQAKSYEMLSSLNFDVEQLSGVISLKGPGFYTGLRLAEGFSDVFRFFGVKQLSFYSYEVPAWCGFESGSWFTKAYRGEYFLYHWEKNKTDHSLISSQDLPHKLIKGQYFIHSELSLDTLSAPLVHHPIHTHDLLKQNPQKVFRKVIEDNLERVSFYFRAPEDEFKVNP